jgi:anti-sigma factor RsiW
MNGNPIGREPVSERTTHLDAITLERLAEGSLPSVEATAARQHVDACHRCASELGAYESLFAALRQLPRYAPSAGFADAVMARVVIAPRESPVWAWLRKLAPSTRRGWALIGVAVAAPATPILALLLWLMTQPLLSPTTFAQWALMRLPTVDMVWATLVEYVLGAGAMEWVELAYTNLQAVPLAALLGLAGFLAIGIPLSGWGLLRLTRTPVGSITYAN